MGTMNSRTVVLVAVLGAFGNILSGLSIYSAPLIPAIPLGAISVSLALDLSHLSTFIGALVDGGLAAYQFGFAQGNIITGGFWFLHSPHCQELTCSTIDG